MFCLKCGSELNEGAAFCSKCGAKVESQAASAQATPAGFSDMVKSAAGKNKKITIAAIAGIAVLLLIIIIAGSSESGVINMQNDIARLTTDVPANAEAIVALYGEYESLSPSKKNKIENREALLSAYNQAVTLIEERKANASRVDALITQIDTGNRYAMVSTAKMVESEYSKLDEYERAYLQYEDQWNTIYNEAKDFSADVTADNFDQLYTLEYEVGEMESDSGSSSTGEYNDYYLPVYVFVIPNYPNLTNECSFYIDLHQTYSGLNIISSDVHEYYRQSGTIEYDSSMDPEGAKYKIRVDNMETHGGLMDEFFQFHDIFHSMNDFDEGLVEVKDVTGYVGY